MPKAKTSVESEEKSAFEDAGLGFVVKSLITRDPNKRRIKPVESVLGAFDPVLNDDSESDDSDYKPSGCYDDDVDLESDDEAAKNNNSAPNATSKGFHHKKGKNGDEQHNGNDVDDESDDDDSDLSDSSDSISSEADDEEDDIDDLENENIDTTLNSTEPAGPTNETDNYGTQVMTEVILSEVVASSCAIQSQPRHSGLSNLKKVLICCICLGDVSRNDDEIVECDSCGISVHEACYGITADDSESVHSNASSASTEPWFCDPCKAGIKNPQCELCPNTGGIYKMTNTEQWVHMVCALYTQGVIFTDEEKLRAPSLSQLAHTRWGRSCTLCEDERLSFTGVCVCCDAGMCKTYFHVTCAQREGFLCAQSTDEVDPFIVYCKLHSDRNLVKVKRRNYLALVAKYRILSKNLQSAATIEESITNQRTLSKLFIQRNKFLRSFMNSDKNSINVPPQKRIPKRLVFSPSAMRKLCKKGQLLKMHDSIESSCIDDLSDARRKLNIPPAFSVEFVSYYLDRNNRISQMQQEFKELKLKNQHLKTQEVNIRAKYDQCFSQSERIKSENEMLRAKIRSYLSTLGSLTSVNADNKFESASQTTDQTVEEVEEKQIKRLKIGKTILNLSEMHSPRLRQLLANCSSNFLSGGKQKDTIGGAGLTGSSSKLKNFKQSSCGEVNLKLINIIECATCKETKDQHSLALCDRCHLHYHLYCLDPPLKRMPKKTRFGGWQCSNCTEKDQEENEQNDALEQHSSQHNPSPASESSGVTTDGGNASRSAARKLRENPKVAIKYEEESLFAQIASMSGQTTGNNTSRGRPRGRNSGGSSSTGTTSAATTTTTTTSTSNTNIPSTSMSNRRGRKPKNSTATTVASEENATSTPAALTTASNSSTSTSTTSQPVTATSGRKRRLSVAAAAATVDDGTVTSTAVGTTTATTSLVVSTTSNSGRQSGTNSPITAPPPVKRAALVENCNGCNKEAHAKQSIRCDNCQGIYHFACLEPPCNKSPKRRGYTWCCYICEKKNGEKRDHSHAHERAGSTAESIVSQKTVESTTVTKQIASTNEKPVVCNEAIPGPKLPEVVHEATDQQQLQSNDAQSVVINESSSNKTEPVEGTITTNNNNKNESLSNLATTPKNTTHDDDKNDDGQKEGKDLTETNVIVTTDNAATTVTAANSSTEQIEIAKNESKNTTPTNGIPKELPILTKELVETQSANEQNSTNKNSPEEDNEQSQCKSSKPNELTTDGSAASSDIECEQNNQAPSVSSE